MINMDCLDCFFYGVTCDGDIDESVWCPSSYIE